MLKKSKCHHERRNSPSVAHLSPTSSCFLMIFSISRSSTSLSCAAVISPFSRFARASFNGAVGKMLPTISARNGALVLDIGRSSKNFLARNKPGRRGSSTEITSSVVRWATAQLQRSHLDHHFAVDDRSRIGLHRHHAGRRHHLTGADVELPTVEIAFDDIAVDIALR